MHGMEWVFHGVLSEVLDWLYGICGGMQGEDVSEWIAAKRIAHVFACGRGRCVDS